MPGALPFFTDPAWGQGVSNLAAALMPPRMDPLEAARAADYESQADLRQFQMDAGINLQNALANPFSQPGVLNPDLMGYATRVDPTGSLMGRLAPFLAMSLGGNPGVMEDFGRATMMSHGNALNEDSAAFTARADDVAARNHGNAMELERLQGANSLASAMASGGNNFRTILGPDNQPTIVRAEDAVGQTDYAPWREANAIQMGVDDYFALGEALDARLGVMYDDDGGLASGSSRIDPEDRAFLLSQMGQLTGQGVDPATAADQVISRFAQSRERGRMWGGAAPYMDYSLNDVGQNASALARSFGDNVNTSQAAGGPSPAPSPAPQNPQNGEAPPVPPADQRVDGQIYMTPRGPARWNAARGGWEIAS